MEEKKQIGLADIAVWFVVVSVIFSGMRLFAYPKSVSLGAIDGGICGATSIGRGTTAS